MTFIPHVIDGQESESVSGPRFASVDPWTHEPYADVALGGPEAASTPSSQLHLSGFDLAHARHACLQSSH